MMKRNDSPTWRILWIIALAILVLFLAGYNLQRFPPTWFDEGIHLLVAKTLALEGIYRFGPAVGPTVFAPVAMAFRVIGVTLFSARLVMVGYLLLCMSAFYTLAQSLGDWKVATVATLLFVSSPGVNLARWGRQVLGEIPATFFLLLGILIWLKTLDQAPRTKKSAPFLLSGLFIGLAIITKNQFLLVFAAWFVLWVADRLYYRQAGPWAFALPLFAATACVVGWYLGQRLILPSGTHLADQNLREWSAALNRGLLTFSPRRALEAVKFLTSQEAFYCWALPGALYGLVLSMRRSRMGLRWATLTIVVVAWFAWFTFFSVSWPRYAFLPLTLTAILVAQLLHDLTGGYSPPLLNKPSAWLRASESAPLAAARVALLALLLLIILRPLQGRLTEVIAADDDTPQQMAAYIVEHLPGDAVIETYEPEVCFLAAHPCHLPPSAMMDASILYVWYGAPPPSEYYDWREYGAPYLLIGEFGRWVHLYDPEIVEREYSLLISIGSYELYQTRQDE